MPVLFLLLLFQLKHFVCDFLYQPPYMFKNKGTYGHWGGIAHAGFHTVATAAILRTFSSSWSLVLALSALEFVVHYHIDFAKMWMNAVRGWTPACNAFWLSLGVDQLAHQLTYLALVALFVAYGQ